MENNGTNNGFGGAENNQLNSQPQNNQSINPSDQFRQTNQALNNMSGINNFSTNGVGMNTERPKNNKIWLIIGLSLLSVVLLVTTFTALLIGLNSNSNSNPVKEPKIETPSSVQKTKPEAPTQQLQQSLQLELSQSTQTVRDKQTKVYNSIFPESQYDSDDFKTLQAELLKMNKKGYTGELESAQDEVAEIKKTALSCMIHKKFFINI